jgi:hypothetical protein
VGKQALSAAELTDMKSQSIFNIIWPMEASFHQRLYPVVTCGGASQYIWARAFLN